MNRIATCSVTVAAALASSAFAMAWSSPARACSGLVSVNETYPRAYDTDVPLDVAPWLRGYALAPPAVRDVRVERAAGGVVPTTLATYPSGGIDGILELTPSSPLEPETDYVIVVDVGSSDPRLGETRIPFRSGSALSGPPGPAPVLGAFQLFETEGLNSCRTQSVFCVDTVEPTAYEVRVVTTDVKSVHFLPTGSSVSDVFGWPDPGQPFCLEVRSRAPNGVRSDPAMLCRGDAIIFSANWDDPGALRCDEGRLMLGDDYLDETMEAVGAGGCSVGGRSTPPLLASMLAAALLLARRRRGSCRGRS